MYIANQEPPIIEFDFALIDQIKIFRYSQNFSKIDTYHYTDPRRLTMPLSAIPRFKELQKNLQKELTPYFLKLLTIDSKHRYPKDLNELAEQVKFSFNIVNDLPGFRQGAHLDNRLTAASGIINLMDNCVSTQFSTGIDQLPYWSAPTKEGRGAIWLNTENQWHMVPTVINDRKIMLFNFWLI